MGYQASVVIGRYQRVPRSRWKDVGLDVKIAPKQDGGPLVLTISAEVGQGSHCEAAGQILNADLNDYLTRKYVTKGELDKLYAVWGRWHLNDMRAGCEHQEAAGWGKRRLDSGKWAGHAWEHEGGCLCKPCPECGYQYGTAWLHEELGDELLQWPCAAGTWAAH